MAFELFVFVDGYKLCVYEDGKIILLHKDEIVDSNKLTKKYYNTVLNNVTVY